MSEWIEHDGSGCPVPKGTMVEAVDRRGVVSGPFPAMCCRCNPLSTGPTSGSAWEWGSNSNWPEYEITHWRLSDTDDKAKREARMENFRKMAQPNELDVRPVKSPQKVGADQ